MKEKKNMVEDTSRSRKLFLMKREMRKCKNRFYFFRNNFRSTNYYYNKFIEIIGLENWKNLDSYYKSEWNSARYSFDRMYGLIRAWYQKNEFPLASNDNSKNDDPRQILAEVSEKVDEIAKQLNNKETLALEKAVKNISESVEQLREHIKNDDSSKTNLEKDIEKLTANLDELLKKTQNQDAPDDKKDASDEKKESPAQEQPAKEANA
ncbi:MAG: hypothetical protein IKM00_10740 [Clostridia bacterium]|nr:hypothetical protein [Clostridia bacterium]